ncbi:DUF2058 domain-containing protein [Corallococcus sp. ZKHCc1 1396]|uniref:DUF2058 domain-containing protein n=1 Tax=Corallococcus soli TaxID=2710757 RepID=A0ABR9PIN2_9BACT|nr:MULTISPECIES: DUF2058 family protein [Corallococcus]MBE4747699.1 DUF2058 domain-containing protein [Corallococcus soli]MCY1031101.1 DUF2058 family protein [Corallococcus sp. BB11-1]
MQNLRDKLLKAGLVSEEQAKKTESSPAPPRRPASSPEDSRGSAPRAPAHRGRDENRTSGGPPRRDDRGGPPRQGAGGPPRREGGGAPPRQGAGGPPRREGGGFRGPQGGFAASGRPGATTDKPIPKLPPLPGSKAYQRAESKKQVELDRALRELVLGSQVPQEPGETTFYFMTRKGKLRRMDLSPTQAKQLEEGELGVVERPEPAQIEHSLVPAAAAEQMFQLSAKAVRFFNRKESPVGFMNDEQLKAQQAAEAAGTAPEIPDEPEAAAADDASEDDEAPAEAESTPSEPDTGSEGGTQS